MLIYNNKSWSHTDRISTQAWQQDKHHQQTKHGDSSIGLQDFLLVIHFSFSLKSNVKVVTIQQYNDYYL